MMTLESSKKGTQVSTNESTNLSESKVVISLPHLVVFSKVFLDIKWLRPQIEAKNLQHFHLKIKFNNGSNSFSTPIVENCPKTTKAQLFKKYVSIKRAGSTLKLSIKSCSESHKQPVPQLMFSHLKKLQDFLKNKKLKSISKLSYFKASKKDQQAEETEQMKKIVDTVNTKHKKNKSTMDIKASFGTPALVSPPKEENYGLNKFKIHRGHLKQRSVLHIQKPRFMGEKIDLKNETKNCYFEEDKTTAYNSTNKTPQKSESNSRKILSPKPSGVLISKQPSKKSEKVKLKVFSQKNIFRF